MHNWWISHSDVLTESHSLFKVGNQGSIASPTQMKMQTQASMLKHSSQWQRRYSGKWDSKTCQTLQPRLKWEESNRLFSLNSLISWEAKKLQRFISRRITSKNNLFQKVNVTFVVVQTAWRQELSLDTTVFLHISITFAVQYFKEMKTPKTWS